MVLIMSQKVSEVRSFTATSQTILRRGALPVWMSYRLAMPNWFDNRRRKRRVIEGEMRVPKEFQASFLRILNRGSYLEGRTVFSMNFILAFLLACWSVRQPAVSFTTLSITNDDYVAARAWASIPVDHQDGEDLNSARYGGIFYPPKIRNSELREERTTIARGLMEIGIHLQNQTSITWLVDEVKLHVVETYPLSEIKTEAGTWQVGSRASAYKPYFEIQSDQSVIVDIPDQLSVAPQEEIVDRKMIFEVGTLQPHQGQPTVYRFNFSLVLMSQDEANRTLAITSDKDYFIATK